MKRIIYTSFLIPAERVDDTLLLLILLYMYFCEEVQGGKDGRQAAEVVTIS